MWKVFASLQLCEKVVGIPYLTFCIALALYCCCIILSFRFCMYYFRNASRSLNVAIFLNWMRWCKFTRNRYWFRSPMSQSCRFNRIPKSRKDRCILGPVGSDCFSVRTVASTVLLLIHDLVTGQWLLLVVVKENGNGNGFHTLYFKSFPQVAVKTRRDVRVPVWVLLWLNNLACWWCCRAFGII